MQSEEILRPLDDIRVRGGACNWYEVANAIAEVRRRLEAALSAAKPVVWVDAQELRYLEMVTGNNAWQDFQRSIRVGGEKEGRSPLYAAPPALSAQVQDVAIPEGWQLVPKEPTKRMLKELCLIDGFSDRALKQRYRDMLAAAPAKQEGKP